jgi:hypothetical protein
MFHQAMILVGALLVEHAKDCTWITEQLQARAGSPPKLLCWRMCAAGRVWPVPAASLGCTCLCLVNLIACASLHVVPEAVPAT